MIVHLTQICICFVLFCNIPAVTGRLKTKLSCPYIHPLACKEGPAVRFLTVWARRNFKGTQDLLDASRELISVTNHEQASHAFTRGFPINPSWLQTCLSGYLLAIFATSRGEHVHSWVFYELGMAIVASCDYDDDLFFSLFGITPTQISYVLFLLSHLTSWPHHNGNDWNPPAAAALLGAQTAEGGWGSVQAVPLAQHVLALPLVVDVGMGLGADTRYYLTQGFRVVAVEPNPMAIAKATADGWLEAFLRSGQLVIMAGAVADGATKDQEDGVMRFFVSDVRAEQSRGISVRPEERGGGKMLDVQMVSCSQVLLEHGRPMYMKIDAEEQTLECIASMHRAMEASHSSGKEFPGPPTFLSFEVENPSLLPVTVEQLLDLGYTLYKVTRQSIYSPGPCETRRINETKILGCGSGPFGAAAVDYHRGVKWAPLQTRGLEIGLLGDEHWHRDSEDSRDWFDVHVKLSDMPDDV